MTANPNPQKNPNDLWQKLQAFRIQCIEPWPAPLRPFVGLALTTLFLALVLSAGMQMGSVANAGFVRASAIAGISLITIQTFYLYSRESLGPLAPVRTLFMIALLSTCIGASLYAARLGMPPLGTTQNAATGSDRIAPKKDESKKEESKKEESKKEESKKGESKKEESKKEDYDAFSGPNIAERYGRHVFLALPVLQGAILAMAALRMLLHGKNLSPKVRSSAPIAVVVFIMHAGIIVLTSSNIKEWHLASEGPPQGDMNPIYSMIVPVALLGLGAMAVSRWKWLEQVRVSNLILFGSTLITLAVALFAYTRFGGYFGPGTGIGVITTAVTTIALLLASATCFMAR